MFCNLKCCQCNNQQPNYNTYKNGFYLSQVGDYSLGDIDSKKHVNCVLLNHKMRETYKSKETQNYISCLSRIKMGADKKEGHLLSQDWVGSTMVA